MQPGSPHLGEAGDQLDRKKDPIMRFLELASLASLLIATTLTGCSSHNYNEPMYPGQASTAQYSAAGGNYRTDTAIGPVMTTPQGNTVYTFDKDQSGKTNCYGECAKHWPPVTAAADAKPYGRMTLVSRTDGQRQWAYDGKPLYLYHDDVAPGDVEGDNEGGIWHVVR